MRWVSSRRQAALHTHFCQRSVYLLTTGVAQFQSKTAQGRQGTFSFLMPPLPCRLDVCTWGCRLTTALTSRQLEPVGHPEWPFHGVWWGDYRDALKCLKLNSSWERTGRYLRSSVELHVRRVAAMWPEERLEAVLWRLLPQTTCRTVGGTEAAGGGGGAGGKCPSYTQTCLPTPRKQVARALRSDGTFSVSDGTIYEITLRSFLSCSGFCFHCYCDFSGNRILNTASLRYLLV